MNLKRIIPLMLAALFLWSATASAAEIFRVAVGDPEDSEQGYAAKAFKKYMEEQSKGQVEVQLFFGGSLGDESEVFRNVQKGSQPFAVGGIANLVPFEKRLGILTLPYLFDNLDEVVAGTNGKPAELLNSYATKAGFRVLCWTYTDFRYISNSKHPVKKMSDMADLKFRVPQSAVLIASYKAFGGSPTPISWAETFTALQQGVVDGQCYGYIGFEAMKFLEANQKYLTEVHYTYQLQPLVMSERARVPQDEARNAEACGGRRHVRPERSAEVPEGIRRKGQEEPHRRRSAGRRPGRRRSVEEGRHGKGLARNGRLRGWQGRHQRIPQGLRQA